jgi:hypothetical protein
MSITHSVVDAAGIVPKAEIIDSIAPQPGFEPSTFGYQPNFKAKLCEAESASC